MATPNIHAVTGQVWNAAKGQWLDPSFQNTIDAQNAAAVGTWVPPAVGPYGATSNGRVWSPSLGGYVDQTAQSQIDATNASNTAATTLAKNAAIKSDPSYVAPMSAAEQSSSMLALRQLADQESQQLSPQQLNQQRIDAQQAANRAAGLYNPPPNPAAAQAARIDAENELGRQMGAAQQAEFAAEAEATRQRAADAEATRQRAAAAAADQPDQNIAGANAFMANFRDQMARANAMAPDYNAAQRENQDRANAQDAEAEQQRERLAQIAEAARAAQAGEALTAEQQQLTANLTKAQLAETERQATAQLAEQQREAQASESLAQSKFNQTVSDRQAALAALNNLASNGMAGPGGGFASGSGSDSGAVDTSLNDAASTAAMTTAKEQGGQATAASLRGLQALMAARGISGSGIEAANTRGLFASNLGSINDTARGLVQAKVARAQQVEDRNFAAAQAARQQYINSLLGVYGMSY